MNIDSDLRADIEALLTVARPKLIAADNGEGSKLFNEVSYEFGPIAHRVYLALDKPERLPDRYHDESTRRVMLDPCTVLNRSKTFLNSDIGIDDPEFWMHADMIKTLCDYILIRNLGN